MAKRTWLTPTVVTTALIGSLVMTLVCTFASPTVQLAVLGTYVSAVTGLVLDLLGKQERLTRIEKQLGCSWQIARNSAVFREYEKIVKCISETIDVDNQLFQELALEQLQNIGNATETISRGTIEFNETETWRVAYERILRSFPVSHYCSVAYVNSKDYWQDEPGKRSLQLNYQLQDEKGLTIERIAIIADTIWPAECEMPDEPIRMWLIEQHERGIWIELLRQSQIVDEPDLHRDFGIYTDLAAGQQSIDQKSRTTQFALSFSSLEIEAAKQRWERLKLFSKSIHEILDRSQ